MSTTPSAQVAVVTGAARGIGLEIAHRFEVENYHVIFLDNDKATLQQCKTNLKGKGNYSFEICGWGRFAEFAALRNGFKISQLCSASKIPF
jgi:NAD(P)-dependent dehydrogenase (short-subunit alcohol dehydrogenase family)